MTPLVARIIDDADLPPLPYLLAIAFGSNAGSMATLTGNPQNMLVGMLSGISWSRFTAALARVDWPLLLFFAGLFVVVAGVGRSGLAERRPGWI